MTATTALDEARATLPRTIRAFEFSDPVLTMFGEEWSLNLMCPWQIEGPGWSYTWVSETIEDDAWELVGHNLVGILSSSPDILDPVFEFDGGIRLSVLARQRHRSLGSPAPRADHCRPAQQQRASGSPGFAVDPRARGRPGRQQQR